MKSKTRHVEGGGKNPQFEAPRIRIVYFHQKVIKVYFVHWDAALLQLYSIDIKTHYKIKILNSNRLKMYTPMKSKTRHADGGGGKPNVHRNSWKMNGQMKFETNT